MRYYSNSVCYCNKYNSRRIQIVWSKVGISFLEWQAPRGREAGTHNIAMLWIHQRRVPREGKVLPRHQGCAISRPFSPSWEMSGSSLHVPEGTHNSLRHSLNCNMELATTNKKKRQRVLRDTPKTQQLSNTILVRPSLFLF